jgi:hypothetical protein
MTWVTQPGPHVLSETQESFVDDNSDSGFHAVGKSPLDPSVFPDSSSIPPTFPRAFRPPLLRTRKYTPEIETRQNVPNQPQYPVNGYGQASEEQINAMISQSTQASYMRMPQNIPSQTQSFGNNYGQASQEQYHPMTNQPAPTTSHTMHTPNPPHLQHPFPEDHFFLGPNFGPYEYNPLNPK